MLSQRCDTVKDRRDPVARTNMLLTLRIRNLVIVEELFVEFGSGLNVLTGETGAGKSILVDALGLLAGARTDRAAVRSGARRATVEALFEPGPDSAVFDWLRERGLEGDDSSEQVLVHREIAASGSGRVLVNGSPCTLSLLRELGPELLELHGQHEHQGLLAAERQLELLDLFCGAVADREKTGELCARVATAQNSLRSLREESTGVEARKGELESIVREIDALRPEPGELERLDRERTILRSAGRMAELLDDVVAWTYEGELTAGSLAANAASKAEELAALDPELDDVARRLRESAVELQDIGATVRDYRQQADFDPARLEHIEERRVALERLCLRHAEDETGLLRLRDATQQQLENLRGLDRELERATEKLAAEAAAYTRAATALTRRRHEAVKPLARSIEGEFASLALEKARFDVSFAPSSEITVVGASEQAVPLHPGGAERAEFLLAANPGEPFRALRQVASGGELSRLMLSLHGIAERAAPGPVLIFDEVDAGVGGAVADAVGVRLSRLAERQQVLCVTHLAQVAAHGQTHFHVTKTTANGRTSAAVKQLGRQDRIEELARMTGGKQPTAAARKHAAELLEHAGGRSLGRKRSRA